MRKQVSQEEPKSVAYKVFYWLIVTLIAAVWIYAFKSYFNHYDSMHPEITWAVPWVHADIVSIDGILLWDEDLITAPKDGVVTYPLGTGPIRVPKGAVVARVSSGSSASDVKTREDGYFIAGLDGSEGKWRYPLLWPGMDELPAPKPVKMLGDSSRVKKGSPIGKLIPKAQDLRLIGYLDLTENILEKLASNKVMVKMDPLDTSSKARVGVYDVIGHRAKVCLDVPWFPPEMLLSRKYNLLIDAGEMSGVVIPETAVGIKGGKKGAYVLKGSDAVFAEVKGRVINGGKFLVTDGLKLGDAVIEDAYGAVEGKVRLW
jgi:hypothetical protein